MFMHWPLLSQGAALEFDQIVTGVFFAGFRRNERPVVMTQGESAAGKSIRHRWVLTAFPTRRIANLEPHRNP